MKVLENTVVGYRRERKWFGESKLGRRWIMLASGKSSDLVGVTESDGLGNQMWKTTWQR